MQCRPEPSHWEEQFETKKKYSNIIIWTPETQKECCRENRRSLYTHLFSGMDAIASWQRRLHRDDNDIQQSSQPHRTVPHHHRTKTREATSLASHGVDKRGADILQKITGGGCLQLEDALDHGDLRGGGVHAGEGHPIVGDEATADHTATAVHRACHHGHLQQRGELLEVFERGVRMHQCTLIGDGGKAAHQRALGDGLTEHLDVEHVGDDFLGFLLQIRMNQRYIVVAHQHVAQCTETLLDALNAYAVRQQVADVLQLFVGGGGRYEQTLSVASHHSTHDTCVGNTGGHNGNFAFQLSTQNFEMFCTTHGTR
mmetsp:Transcript_3672/g.8883  ORF Transcript_3672/g.8883 Transcript_3672/m.8883 type:complete len:313 (+) Transcript_3672:44-982(+)